MKPHGSSKLRKWIVMNWDRSDWMNHDESLNIYKLITIIQIIRKGVCVCLWWYSVFELVLRHD